VTGKPISRRRALGLIALGGASLAAGATGWVGALGAPGARGRLRPGPAGQLLTQPTVLASRNGVLRVRLTAAAGVWLAGRDTRGLGFNGISPGPTLRVRPGELLQVRLVNQLDQPTNLHTHGLALAGDEGARMREALIAMAATIGSRELAEAEAQANEASEHMVLPLTVLAIGFTLFLLYPALMQLTVGF
jgi:FtsP/CotA-like multicopper oxidase with cupredoxin domain